MSEVKVNKISPRSGTTVTLGDSGDTFTIPSGATINNQGTATNFGPTGSVSWQTTVKTSGFTATAGEGYFVDTSSGAISVNLPAGTAGAVVGFKDYLNTFDTNKLTLVQNGSDKIGGSTVNATIETEGIAITLVFIDSTQGWLVTDSGLQSEAPTAAYIAATGGTVTTVCTNFKVHTFTGPGTFCVSAVGNAAGSNTVDYLVIAGGGGGGLGAGVSDRGAGGGAGGTRFSNGTASGCYSAGPSPLGASALPVTATSFPIVVGAGGAQKGGFGNGNDGATSSFSTISSAGGGGGGTNSTAGNTGGSGGGAGGGTSGSGVAGGAGNTPPVSPPQGGNGGTGGGATPNIGGGGGGGATGNGGNAKCGGSPGGTGGGDGGAALTSSINGTPTARGGGGAGDKTGSATGGGAGGPGACQAATVNSGGGGQGGHPCGGGNGSAGGSGIVIIRYKFQ